MAFDTQQQKQIMGKFATGVTVAGVRVGDETWGMTANAVASLSLDPPQVLLCVVRESQSYEKFKQANAFALSILGADQEPLSNRFAFAGPKDFSGLKTRTAETGAPILADALGWLDCRVANILPGGDHEIFIGEILAGGVGSGEPLLYFDGKYARLAANVE